MSRNYQEMYREKGGSLPFPFLTPGLASYKDVLWDWDSYFSNVALKQILREIGTGPDEAMEYERGCILNYRSYTGADDFMLIMIGRNSPLSNIRPEEICKENMHKPILAQHAVFLVKQSGGGAEWLLKDFSKLQYFINNYLYHLRHATTGLFTGRQIR